MIRSAFRSFLILIGCLPTLHAADPLLVPADTTAYLSIDIAKLRKNASAELVRVATDGATAGEWDKLAKSVGFDVGKVERVTVLAPTFETLIDPIPRVSPTSQSVVVAVACSAPVDPEKLKKALGPNVREKKYKNTSYQFDPRTWSGLVVLPGNTTFLIGAEDSIVWYLERIAVQAKSDPFAAAAAAAQKRTVVLAVNPTRFTEQLKNLPPDFQTLAEMRMATVELDLEGKLTADIRFDFPDEPTAKAGVAAVKKAAEMGRMGVAMFMAQLEKDLERETGRNHLLDDTLFRRGGELIARGFLHRVDKELETLPLAQAGTAVTIAYDKVNIPEWAAVPALSLTGGLFRAGGYAIYSPAGNSESEVKRRKKLFDAIEAYHEKHGHYPPAATAGKPGEPATGWRMELLPFLGHKDLSEQFRRSEPWDSLHNKKLIEKIPDVYGVWANTSSPGTSKVLAVVGPGTVFDPKVKVKKSDLADPANTILWVEPNAWRGKFAEIYWTSPDDAAYDGKTPPDLFGEYSYSLQAMMADGKWRTITKDQADKELPLLFLVKKK